MKHKQMVELRRAELIRQQKEEIEQLKKALAEKS
jgi:hypothetical protein